MELIYLDHAATTPMRPAAIEAMERALEETYGNASAVYRPASRAKQVLENARAVIAGSIGAARNEIYFTSGGTESDNWALTAAVDAMNAAIDKCSNGRFQSDNSLGDGLSNGINSGRKPRIITTAIEHHAILTTCEYLRRQNRCDVTILPVDGNGIVNPESVRDALEEDVPEIVSVMAVNNEIGTIEPIAEIAEIVKQYNDEHSKMAAQGSGKSAFVPVLFHTDAVQAYGKIPLRVDEMSIDLLSVSAHKIGGPKGIGFLYIRNNLQLGAFMHGGMQERGRRAGTENVPAAAGFAAAVSEFESKAENKAVSESENKAVSDTESLQLYFWNKVKEAIPDVILNGPVPGKTQARIFNNLNFSIPGVEAESVLIMLDMQGICASGGSACTTGALEPSHVLTAIGADKERARGALRFTIGAENTREEIDRTVQVLTEIAVRLRTMGGH
jgi:cysteine desulfurase